MEIETRLDIINDNYRAQIGITTGPGSKGLSPLEAQGFQMFGDQVVECGGVITLNDSSGLTFTLPTNPLRFPSQFPVIQTFSVVDLTLATAQLHASSWLTQVQNLMVAAKNYVTTQSTGYLGHTITNL